MAFKDEIITGVNMILSVDGEALGSSSTCSVEINRNTRDVGSKDTGIWDAFAAGTMNWSMSSENFVNFSGTNGFRQMLQAMKKGDLVDVACEYDEDKEGINTYKLSGKALITSLPLTAPRGETMTFTISFQGSGELLVADSAEDAV
ncbi:phage tail tube protein [Marinilabilia salmonicolor]|uniref:phage tail tube protein n=1 Tax=Marinilabilia salmonicolor TaxID=989 RepID=UPI00029A7881|nr:phage tail tube protein [Marinilabilia salmonicolor]